ncbi:hypothetical protein WICPIJ_000021 [Wickerhamomyces pijperi]|uniref:Uncharacterized protein n=1 Tax=Wickerhamomyces pijperi TaxID=599730 RepID=A0A9P8QDF9_WICPI|nr:hypothetical protein WICPIJ_000021 [Wickerhamomyces pijperi]
MPFSLVNLTKIWFGLVFDLILKETDKFSSVEFNLRESDSKNPNSCLDDFNVPSVILKAEMTVLRKRTSS